MSYPINYPTPQGANVQIFQEGGSVSDWVKPQGASFVWFTLIGAGGMSAGGSGAVTNFMGPAFLIPDVLRVSVGKGVVQGSGLNATASSVSYQQKSGTGYLLLNADFGLNTAGAGGTAMTPNYFTAMGIFQSVDGQAGSTSSVSASTTTFLSGGGGNTVTSNYGYGGTLTDGYFQMQPIIVGVGGANNNVSQAGLGCGGANAVAARSGDGMVVIITW